MKRRETELDILRIIALLLVIWAHVGGMETRSLPTSNTDCQMLIFLKSMMTWQIPVYIMLSGRFFLDPEREIGVQRIIRAIVRLLIAFVFWDVVYQIWYIVSGVYSNLNWKGILSQTVIGPYHFWYLHMIIGIYLIVPFLRKIACNRRLSEYFILLSLLFSFLDRYATAMPYVGATLGAVMNYMSMRFVSGFAGTYILGYYLYKFPVPDKWEWVLYITGAVLAVLGAAGNTWCSVNEGVYVERYTATTFPNTVIIACAVYTFFVKRVRNAKFPEKHVSRITKLSENSFGVYLIHALLVDCCKGLGLKPTLVHPLIMMPVITLIIFAAANVLVMMIRRIPVVGRKIT